MAARIPVSAAAPVPFCGSSMTRQRGSPRSAANASMIGAEPSVDPLSTKTTSKSASSWAAQRLEGRTDAGGLVEDRHDDREPQPAASQPHHHEPEADAAREADEQHEAARPDHARARGASCSCSGRVTEARLPCSAIVMTVRSSGTPSRSKIGGR